MNRIAVRLRASWARLKTWKSLISKADSFSFLASAAFNASGGWPSGSLSWVTRIMVAEF